MIRAERRWSSAKVIVPSPAPLCSSLSHLTGANRAGHSNPKKRAVPVECHLEEHLPAVPVDQIQIQQVFINLIVNAIEALEGQQGPPQVILRAAVADSDRMLIRVIDNGPGVHDSERIFDAFMTTKEKCMGIGLAVSRSIVEAHGGQLWAENNKTGGAIFNVTLPFESCESHGGLGCEGNIGLGEHERRPARSQLSKFPLTTVMSG